MSAPGLRAVTLRTGTQVPRPAVAAVILALGKLMDTDPVALYEAIEMARDKDHVPFGNTGDVLRGLRLLTGSRMHRITRDVILASAETDGDEVRLVSPYASTPDPEDGQ